MSTAGILSTLAVTHNVVDDNRQLTTAVLNACKLTWDVPDDIVSASVTNGWVTLEGEMEWFYQREAAGNAAKRIDGIKGVYNHIVIRLMAPDAADQRI